MTQIRSAIPHTARYDAWLTQLRTGCLMLDAQRDSVVTSFSVTQRFPDASPEELKSLISLATHISAEYGLGATVEEEGAWLTARLFRRHSASNPFPETRQGRRPGWLARLFGSRERTMPQHPNDEVDEPEVVRDDPEHVTVGSGGERA